MQVAMTGPSKVRLNSSSRAAARGGGFLGVALLAAEPGGLGIPGNLGKGAASSAASQAPSPAHRWHPDEEPQQQLLSRRPPALFILGIGLFILVAELQLVAFSRANVSKSAEAVRHGECRFVFSAMRCSSGCCLQTYERRDTTFAVCEACSSGESALRGSLRGEDGAAARQDGAQPAPSLPQQPPQQQPASQQQQQQQQQQQPQEQQQQQQEQEQEQQAPPGAAASAASAQARWRGGHKVQVVVETLTDVYGAQGAVAADPTAQSPLSPSSFSPASLAPLLIGGEAPLDSEV
jgi:hypothetical protein